MKALTKILLSVTVSLMCLFLCVGYAQLSDTLVLTGGVDFEPPKAIYIHKIDNLQTDGVTVNQKPTNIGYPSTKMMSEFVFSAKNASVTFDVYIINNTEFDHYYDVIEEYSSLEGIGGSFSYASTSLSVSVAQGTKVAVGEMAKFTVTIKYTGSSKNQTRRMLHEFDFVLDSKDLTQAASTGVTDRFAKILNNELDTDVTYLYNGGNVTVPKDSTYETMEKNMEWSSSGNFIGNLDGADGDDKALITALFGDTLLFPVGDQEDVPVTVMVKKSEVYNGGNSNNEIILYITADDLSARSAYVPIFAAVFHNNGTEWVQIGDIYEGEAKTCYYNISFMGYGSFDTDTWRSTKEYYGVAAKSNLAAVMAGYKAENP